MVGKIMMIKKYIRTHSGIYEVEDIDTHGVWIKNSCYMIPNKIICSSADTIDELYDDTMFYYPDIYKPTCKIKKGAITDKEYYSQIKYMVTYACVWLFKDNEDVPSLVPIARLNNKGEWELL